MKKKLTEREKLIKKIQRGKKLFRASEVALLSGLEIEEVWENIKKGKYGFVVHRGLPYFTLDTLLTVAPEVEQYVPKMAGFFRPGPHYHPKNTVFLKR